MPRAIDQLAAVAAHLRDTDHPMAGWLTEAVAVVRLGASVEAALGLAHGYDACCRQQAQDAALAALVAAAPVQPTANARAAWIAREVALYERTEWRHDRAVMRRPDGVRGCLFDLMVSKAPLSARSLRRILSTLANNNDDLANGSRA